MFSSPNVIRVTKTERMRWVSNVTHMGKTKGAFRVPVGKPDGKRLLLRPRCRWEDNIKTIIQEKG